MTTRFDKLRSLPEEELLKRLYRGADEMFAYEQGQTSAIKNDREYETWLELFAADDGMLRALDERQDITAAAYERIGKT